MSELKWEGGAHFLVIMVHGLESNPGSSLHTKYRRAPAEAGELQGKHGLPQHHLVQGPPAETATDRSQKTGPRQACSDQGHNVTFSEMTVTRTGKEVKESTRETSGLF